MKWYVFLGFCLCTCTCAVVILLLSSDGWHQTNPPPSKTSKGRDVTTLHRTVEPPTSQSTCCELTSGFSLEKLCLPRNGSTRLLELENLTCSCTDLLYCRLVVMTALDSDHYKEAIDMIASVHTFLPNTKIILYELAMKDDEKKFLSSLCNVELRSFQFDKYPPHTRNTHTYAFKPLSIWEVCNENEVVLWLDASIRIRTPFVNHLPKLLNFPFLAGLAMKVPVCPPIIAMTDDGMCEYLNISLSREELRKFTGSIETGAWIIWVTPLMTEKILNPWKDCALHEECIHPNASRSPGCHPGNWKKVEAGKGVNVGCHLYDQSALNLLLIREFGFFIWDKVVNEFAINRSVFRVARYPTHFFKNKLCKTH